MHKSILESKIRQDLNMFEIADEYAKRLQEQVDEIALDKAAGTLAKFGYVKVRTCTITPITSLSDMGRCSNCGKIADVTSNYCWQCGAKVIGG